MKDIIVNSVGSQKISMLSRREYAIIIGTILGDGYIEQFAQEARLCIAHSVKQQDYVVWKYHELERWVKNPPQLVEYFDKRYQKFYNRFRFRTIRHGVFREIAQLFYREKKKVIPHFVNDVIKYPLALAVWYMDDGGRRNDCHGLFLNTLSFSQEENHKLQSCLKENFGLSSRIHWISDGYRIYIPTESAKLFCKIVAPYIIPSMVYKLSFDPVTTESAGIWRKR